MIDLFVQRSKLLPAIKEAFVDFGHLIGPLSILGYDRFGAWATLFGVVDLIHQMTPPSKIKKVPLATCEM